MDSEALLRLLQLASPTLPVGAYAYSEGLEFLIQTEQITNAAGLQNWITAELMVGAIRVDAAIGIRAYQGQVKGDLTSIRYWNHWLTAARDGEALRQQSLQMGRSLWQLFCDLEPETQNFNPQEFHHFAVAFGRVAGAWQIDLEQAILGFLQSWTSNLINAGVKLIPLGQTQGQRLLLTLHQPITQACAEILNLEDDQLDSCSWGLSLGVMGHETLYSRLFRS
ncbi:urease accessory protein UreF [Thermosynechococcaceae cyanobacterium BACA0444]|uniref:Urease accessory protein UreF n=1 Tax=Pseudocalidococcus azoricus BACA0444 TaxID=2918990 RepID=A0AAE4JY42_9CYAN|nr:urease accessory protein UreF [Pseudocalidococcus azoricus]MDS3860609.1 urease accessory protein UreF [Pseudocalidococcus azoricus BACA0444]